MQEPKAPPTGVRGTRRGHLAVLVALAMVATGCGLLGSDDDDAAIEQISVSTTEAGAVDLDAYCLLRAEVSALNAGFTAFDDPAALEQFVTQLNARLAATEPPAEIAEPFETVRGAWTTIQSELEAQDYAFAALAQSSAAGDPAVLAANDAVEAHDAAVCTASAETAQGADGDVDVQNTSSVARIFADAVLTGDYSQVEKILESDEGRTAFASSLSAAAPAISQAQAECFVDALPPDLVVSIVIDPASATADDERFAAALTVCQIPVEAFEG